MSFDQLTLEYWDGLDSATRAQIARLVGETLPPPFRFAELETHALGDQRHEMAYFDYDGARFALLPGGEVTLGFDRSGPFVPGPLQQAYIDFIRDWEEMADEVDTDIASYLRQMNPTTPAQPFLTPLRQVQLAPFLLEVTARYAARAPVPAEEYFTAAELAGFHAMPGLNSLKMTGGKTVEVQVDARGRVQVFVEGHPTHAQVVAQIDAAGFRLPTSDEWEYACAGGARTLFRWGDDCPLLRLPTADEWDPPELEAWDLHEQPNAFGLHLSGNPYNWELCAEPGLMRGGDGGNAICGGDGPIAAWVTLASAYAVRWNHDKLYGAHVRRAYTLP